MKAILDSGDAGMAEAIEQTFHATAPQVWEALRQTVGALGYKDVRENPPEGTIEFRTGLSLWSWRGQQMTATVREAQPGMAQLSLSGGLALKVQVTSWNEKKRIANKVLREVERRLGGPGPVPAQTRAT